MSKSILKILLISILVAPAAFADTSDDVYDDDTLSTFNKQGDDLKYPKPNTEESFFATRAPMEVTLRRYFGLSLGANFASLKPNISRIRSSGSLDSQSLSPNTPKLSWGANLYGGCGTNFDHFYIGAELSGGYNTLKYNQTTTKFALPQDTITFKQPLNLGLDFTPGYITSQKDFLFYGRLGLATSLFNMRINNHDKSAVNKFVFGWRAGFGMEYFISEAFSTRLEYIFTNYNNINQTYTSPKNTTYSYKLTSPHTQQVNLGLTINF